MSAGQSSKIDTHSLLSKSMSLLGWDRVTTSLANHTYSPYTHSFCLQLKPEKEFQTAQTKLEETEEMVALLDSLESFPMDHFDDIRPIFKDIEEQQTIDTSQCLVIMKLLRLCRNLCKDVEKKTAFPLIQHKLSQLDPLKEFHNDLIRCIDDEGNIKENATPELKQAIREIETARTKLEEKIKKLFSSTTIKEALQDSYITERQERLVIPVRSEFKSKVDGIVHDISGTGQTLFIEPASVVPLNNQLKIARLKVAKEKAAILQFLSMQTSQHKESLQNNMENLATLDLIHARARLAKTMDAIKCPMNRQFKMQLKEARNPELTLDGETVVPNTIEWKESTKVVIISGPNTGGKTVTLKTIGLLSLMVRSGLFLPVKKNSSIPFFPEVYSDIGDEQNIQLKLSTFSGHLEKIIRIIESAPSGSLVLLDELGIATDPNEGAALAESILLELKEKNIMTLVSTHYFSLKILAQTQEGFLNACTEFDLDTSSPTYRLIFGAPGQSAALDTAERLGLQPKIIDQARNIYQAKDKQAENLLEDLTQQRLQIHKDQEKIKQLKVEIEQLNREQNKITQELRKEEKEFQRNKSKKLQAEIRAGRNEIRKMIEEIKGEKALPIIRKIDKKIQAMKNTSLQTDYNMEEWSLTADQLKSGDIILILNLGTTATLLESTQGKKNVRVRMGNIKTIVETASIRGNPHQKYSPKNDNQKISMNIETESKNESSCDLRGMNSEEAEKKMEAFISHAIATKATRVKIIHGHGMGTIKTVVKNYLEKTGLCKNFSPGRREEGGTGVTVVEF
ncbi:MAG: endonuclease MutS2 [Nitrospinota bacterium]|nr:endonuclease MutS2 [Nitrospinota bacterium]